MDEGERRVLEGVAQRRPRGADCCWETLRGMALGALWGRSTGELEVDAVDAWVLKAEATR